MIQFICGMLAGILFSIVVVICCIRLSMVGKAHPDPADWWKRGEPNPYEDVQED